MPLKFIAKKEEVPAELAAHYRPEGDLFVLDVEGAEPTARLDEFRSNNRKLHSELSELKDRYRDIDPDKARDLMGRERELSEAKLIKKGDVDAVIQQRVQEAVKVHNDEKEKLNKTIEGLNGKLGRLIIEQSAVQKVLKRGRLRKGAEQDVIDRARNIFRVEDGREVAYEPDGTKKINSRTGQPYSMEDFADELPKLAEFLFEPSQGGGARPGTAAPGVFAPGLNPFKRETLNMTLQAKMLRENPQLARAMATEAGVPLNIPATAA